MSHIRKKHTSDEREEEALRWRVKSESSYQKDLDSDELNEWLSESPVNMRMYESADRFCNAIDGLGEEKRRALLTRYRSAGSYPLKRPWWRKILFRGDCRMTGAAAATVAALVIGLWWVHFGADVPDYTTRIGELRTVSLPDGSSVEMNSDSAILVEMLPELRRISLLKGEAFFTVAPDTQRPFEVLAAQGRVRALGTAFNVRKDRAVATVSVQEHSVRVTSDSDGTSRDVGPGAQVRVGQDGTIAATEPYNESHLLAWRNSRLVFQNRPLPEVLEELNRYRAGSIIALDPKLQSLAVTASFNVTSPNEALLTLESILPIRLYRMTDHLVIVIRGY